MPPLDFTNCGVIFVKGFVAVESVHDKELLPLPCGTDNELPSGPVEVIAELHSTSAERGETSGMFEKHPMEAIIGGPPPTRLTACPSMLAYTEHAWSRDDRKTSCEYV